MRGSGWTHGDPVESRGQLPEAESFCDSQRSPARGVPEVDRLSCCAFVFVDEAAEDVMAVELPRCG